MNKGIAGMMAVTALLLGVLIGSWVAKSGTRALEEELQQAREDLARLQKQKSSAVPLALGLTSLMQSRTGREQIGGMPPPAPDEETPRTVSGEVKAPETAAGDAGGGTPPADPAAAFATMRDTWKIRSVQSKASFLEAAALSENQQHQFERAVEEMNGKIKVALETAARHLEPGQAPDTREMVDLAVVLGEIYQDTDDSLHRSIDGDQLDAGVEAGFDIFSQVNPDVVLPLLQRMDAERSPESDPQ